MLRQTTRHGWLRLDRATRYALILFLIIRLLLSAAAAGAVAAWPGGVPEKGPEPYLDQVPITEGLAGYLLGPWQRWDALWYTKIAHFGYAPDDGSTNAFPLYPLLMRGLASLLGDRYLLAGILISNLAFVATLIYLYRLGEYELGEEPARRAVMYLAVFPTAFFFLAPYTESLFLLGAIGAFYYARRRAWPKSGLFGLIAGLTKMPGALITIPLLWEYVQSSREAESRFDGHVFFALVPALGALSYMLYRYVFIGDIAVPPASGEVWQVKSLLQHSFLLPAAAQENWQWRFVVPWEGLVRGWEAVVESGEILSRARALVELTSVIGLGVATVFTFAKLSRSYAIYMLLFFLSVLMWVDTPRPFSTVYRHSLLFFPGFLLLGWAGQRVWLHRLLILSFVLLLIIFTGFFAGWYWMG